MLNIQKCFVFYAVLVLHCLQHCLAKEQLWGVRFFTGDFPEAGTNKTVHLRLEGMNGTSELKIVSDYGKYPADRQRNTVGYYYLSFKDVGPLQAILVTMGLGKLKKNNWFLRKVEMEKLDNHTRIRSFGIETTGLSSDRVRTFYVFNTSYWFNRTTETKTFDSPTITTDRTYVLRVVTSDMENAGTVSMVLIEFYNNQRQVLSDVIEIKHDDGRHVLRTGTTDTFQYTTKYIGIPDKAKIWFQRLDTTPTGLNRTYRLDRIELEDIESDGKRRVYTFTRSDWMQVDIGQLYFMKRIKIHRTRTYGLDIFTRPDRCGQTDARVWIKLMGQNGKETNYIQLNVPNRNDFEAPSRNWFEVTIEDVGMLKAIKLRIGDRDPWLFGKMYILWPLQTGWKEAYYVGCTCWVYNDVSRWAEYLLKEKPHE